MIVLALLLASASGSGSVSVEVAPRAHVFSVDKPWNGNTLVVEMKTGEIVIASSPYTSAQARDLLAWISKTFPGPAKRTLVVINTHFHNDGTGANDELIKAGAIVYGSDLTARMMRERRRLRVSPSAEYRSQARCTASRMESASAGSQ